MLTSVKSDVKGNVKSDVKQERGKLWLVVSRQEFSAVGALVEQLDLLVDKVRSNKDVEFFGHAKVACVFPWPVWSGSINNIPREVVIGSFEKKSDTDDDEATKSHRMEITKDFKSTKTPPQHELLKPFERDMYNLIGNIEFRRVDDPILQSMNEEVKRINSSTKVIINADKTGNKYEMDPSDYRKLLQENVTRDYKLDNQNKLAEINCDTQKHARISELDDEMECHRESNAFLTIKDHKNDFPNSIKCCVINPASNNLGKVSTRILDDVNRKCRIASGINQWKSTQDVLKWFSLAHSANHTKEKGKFIQFDIWEFYPSITEELLRSPLNFAKSHTTISPDDEELIMACRKSVLFNNGKVWTKKDKDFDVTMGAQDGAEIAELTGIYLLKQVNDYLSSLGEKSEASLYRDDSLIYLNHANGPLISKIEKALHRIFKQNQLKISIEQKGFTVDFLDITLSTDGSHKPYKKPKIR